MVRDGQARGKEEELDSNEDAEIAQGALYFFKCETTPKIAPKNNLLF